MQTIMLADDIVKSLLNDAGGDPTVHTFIQDTINQRQAEAKKKNLAIRKAKLEQMKKKKDMSKFNAAQYQAKEEDGPKCVSCSDGYVNKPTEILGLYVYSKNMKFTEWTGLNVPCSSIAGHSTVTFNNYIHYTCHQAAAKVDYDKQQRIKEWEGAQIRNGHIKCNNLMPVQGGEVKAESF